VDLVGGWADEANTLPWRPDTLVNFYSVGKAIIALLVLQLVDEGRLALDDPIADVWPEFATGGKQRATIRHALCHQAGVPAIRERMTNDELWDWQRMADAVAATEAWYEPGSRHVYHTNTYGHLLGEILRRVTGETPADRLRGVTDLVGADVAWGLSPAQQARCAELLWAPGTPLDAVDPFAITGDGQLPMLSYFNPPGYSSQGVVNTSEWRAASVPSTNGHGSAHGLARIYAAIIGPEPLLSTALLAEATRVQSEGPCPVLGESVAFGLGFTPTSQRRPLGPNPRSFGHFGTGGALGFADPDTGVAFGYVMNHVIPRWQSTRNRALIDAVFSCL
jgi:CubicO group peptidase (beta-lactamase class C family)